MFEFEYNLIQPIRGSFVDVKSALVQVLAWCR